MKQDSKNCCNQIFVETLPSCKDYYQNIEFCFRNHLESLLSIMTIGTSVNNGTTKNNCAPTGKKLKRLQTLIFGKINQNS